MSRHLAKLLKHCLALSAMMICTLAPQTALATPPDVIDLHDEPFGLSATHLFVLRTADDNLGLYQTSRVETFLVAIDLDTSAEEYWPVYRALRTVDYADDGEELGVVVRPDGNENGDENGNEDWADPFAILAQRGGVPWGAVQITWRVDPDPQIVADAGGFTVDQEDRPRITLDRATLDARLAATSSAMAAQISNYGRMSNLQTRDLFAERVIDQSTCTAGKVWQPFFPFGTKIITAVRFTCPQDEDVGTSSLIQLFPAMPDTRTQ